MLLHRKNPQHAVDIIQRVINELANWGEKAGLKFNPQKTVAIMFTRSNKLELPNKIKMYNTEVNYSYETKYLGVLIDSKLLWTKHFNNITTRAKQYMMQMMGALCKKWGPKPRLVRWIYTAIVRPRLSYAAMTWSHSINQKTKLRKLTQINRLASMMMAPARRSTPTRALELINHLMPLDIYLHCLTSV